MNISFDSREQLVGRAAAERPNCCSSPQIQHLIVLYAQKAVSAERQLAQYIQECDSLRRRLEVAEKRLLEHHSLDNGPYVLKMPKAIHARACASKVELGIEQPAERILSLLRSILFLPAAEVAPAEHAEVQTCREQILLCMEKMAEYPSVEKEMFASLHNWSRENMEIDILALMETLQKACRNVTESLSNEDGDPRGMHNPTSIIETLVQTCERMKSLIAGFGHVPYEEKRSGEFKASWRPEAIPSQCVSSVRCSSAASRRFRTTAGAQTKDVQSLIDKYALKAASAEVKLAESVDECHSLRKEMAKSSDERDSLRREAAQFADECISLRQESVNLRSELAKSVDKCESLRRAATQSVDECIAVRREVANLRRELAQSVDECESLRKEVANLRRELAQSVDECESLRRQTCRSKLAEEYLRSELAQSVVECESLRKEVANLRRELAQSVDECESLRRQTCRSKLAEEYLRSELAQSVVERESLRKEVANLRRELAQSVHECESLRRQTCGSKLAEEYLPSELAQSVVEGESLAEEYLPSELAQSVVECESLRKEVANQEKRKESVGDFFNRIRKEKERERENVQLKALEN
ncbi:hypothetical protein KP509_27G001000 [Ceratopteris richardii]|uniref:Uncharacterized protein n=1 Tax=Ceratopteris richardii TaxID=49495 RepID=A0A8T2RFS2_CERRI|nr:hypothetical protein KP509_27G001000 [Ceratopteris richardii]